jgi:hypothetical protein
MRAWHVTFSFAAAFIIAGGIVNLTDGGPPDCPPGTNPIRMVSGGWAGSCNIYDEHLLDAYLTQRGHSVNQSSPNTLNKKRISG